MYASGRCADSKRCGLHDTWAAPGAEIPSEFAAPAGHRAFVSARRRANQNAPRGPVAAAAGGPSATPQVACVSAVVVGMQGGEQPR
jgi:hypothetical protein